MRVLAGRYRLERVLGSGAMGQVWQAIDQVLGRQVAVKLISSRLSTDPGLVERFRREQRISGRFQHPGITVAHDAGEDAGRLFLVMEYLPGEDLKTVLARHPGGLPIERALTVAEQVASTLAAIHDHGVVHRDIKPANLMLLPGDQVKIFDFGIARLIEGTGLTGVGGILGTPSYMAPEQCQSGPVDGRADLYALGCVLFALLTGGPPFGGQVPEIISRHLAAPPPAPSSIRSDVSEDLDGLVLGLLAKDPRDRPAPAETVAAQLKTVGLRRTTPPATPPAAEGPVPVRPSPIASPEVEIEVFANEYLPPGGDRLNLIATLTCSGGPSPQPAAIIFLIGCSPRMRGGALRDAVADAIDLLGPDDTFAVVAGSETVDMVYPRSSRLTRATTAAKAEARRALGLLPTTGHAAFGLWLRFASSLVFTQETANRHVVLLTDMYGTLEDRAELAAAASASGGRYTCDVRGLGTDWEVAQLATISDGLHGTLDIVPAVDDLAADVAQIVTRTRSVLLTDLHLRITTPQNGSVELVRQVSPTVHDLLARATGTDHAIGNWTAESRDFHIGLRLTPGEVGETRLAARLSAVLPGQDRVLAEKLVLATWADDDEPLRINPQVAHYTGQADLARAIEEGLADRRRRPGTPSADGAGLAVRDGAAEGEGVAEGGIE